MKKIFAILVVIATVTAAVFAVSDDQSKELKTNTAEQAADTELILEDWMISPAFESNEAEAEMDLENWMIDNDSFAEENVELEDWMLKDSNSTGNADQGLVLENWMFIYS